jgi:hypothetical protein
MLCGAMCVQQLSHLIPAFVFRWQKESSGNGHLRSSKEPNVRSQDGLKRYWLCTDCEQRFSAWEGEFANKIFHPYLKRSGEVLPYGDWLLRFATSVSWRILTYALEEGKIQSWSDELLAKAKSAEATWRTYLLGKAANPGEFRQLILPMDEVFGFGPDTPANINRYLMRAIELDVPSSAHWAYTFTKMGRFIILGQLSDSDSNKWRAARISANQGTIEPRQFTLPADFWDYLKGRAQNAKDALASMSAKQHAKVDKAFRANLDRYAGSDAFRAMQADVNTFGSDAFSPANREEGDAASQSNEGGSVK